MLKSIATAENEQAKLTLVGEREKEVLKKANDSLDEDAKALVGNKEKAYSAC